MELAGKIALHFTRGMLTADEAIANLADILGWEHFDTIADVVNRHPYRADGDALAASASILGHLQSVIV